MHKEMENNNNNKIYTTNVQLQFELLRFLLVVVAKQLDAMLFARVPALAHLYYYYYYVFWKM